MESVVSKVSNPHPVSSLSPNPALVACEIEDFLSKDYPARPMLLSPWLPSQGLVMVHAKRGIGKTFFALSVGLAVASGTSVFGWEAGRSRSVLYIDGEMSAPMMQERLDKLRAGMRLPKFAGGAFRIITLDDQEDLPGGLNLANVQQTEQLELLLGGVDLVIVDNVSCLFRNGDENSAEHWEPMNSWLLTQRRAGRSVLLVHHSGKGGGQRGTSRREDILDTVLCLNPKNKSDGASFLIEFEKSRSFTGESTDPVDVVLTDSGNRLTWEFARKQPTTYKKVVQLMKQGLTQKEIADELGKNPGTVSKHVKRAREKGELPAE